MHHAAALAVAVVHHALALLAVHHAAPMHARSHLAGLLAAPGAEPTALALLLHSLLSQGHAAIETKGQYHGTSNQ
jgi:hypothetical protein